MSKLLCWCCSQLGHEMVNLMWKIYHAMWNLRCCWRYTSSGTLSLVKLLLIFQRNVVPLLRYTSQPVCLCGMYRNICTFYFYWRHVRIAAKTYVKKSFTISPIRPKWCKDWPCTSHIALRRQALPSIPKLVSKSSTTIYRSALWKQKNTGNHSSKSMNLHYCCCILSLFWNVLLQFL